MRKPWIILAAVLAVLATRAHAADPAPATQRYYEVHGAKLYVETFGAGRPIVFLHGGLNFFDLNFASQRDYFARFYKVVGIDRTGHGHSPDTAQPFSYDRMAEDMAAVIEQLGLGAVDVIGHSDGANIGLILARDHPQLVRRLIISGANLRPGLPAEELQRRKNWTDEQVAAKAREIAGSVPPNFRTEYEKVTPDGADHWWTLVSKSYRLWLTPVVIDPVDLKRIRIPVLVMAGDTDFTPIEETLEIHRNLPRAQLMILPGTGHGTMMQRPALVNLAMREFLDSPDADTKAK